MAIVPSGVSVPAQSKVLDNTTTTTVYGTVYRQVVTLADPETATNYMRVGGNGAYVDVRNVVALPLPTGAATSALQTTGNNTLSAIDTKLGGTLTVNVGLTDAQLRASNVNVAVNSALPTGANTIGSIANTSFAATQSGTWNVTNISGTVSLPTGASTSALQTTGNNTLSAIDTKLGGTLTVNVGLTDAQLRASNVNVAVNAALPTGSNTIGSIANTSFAATQSGTWNVTNISGTVSLPTGAATEATVAGLLTNTQLRASAVETTKKTSSFSHITTNTTTTVKSGAGVLRRIVINTKGSIANTLTIYDNTTGSGTVIGVIDTVNGVSGHFEYGVSFSTGLTIVTANGTAADVTVIYE